MNDYRVYRKKWFESAYKRADALGYTLYRLATPYDDTEGDDGYILEDGETNGIDGIFTAARAGIKKITAVRVVMGALPICRRAFHFSKLRIPDYTTYPFF